MEIVIFGAGGRLGAALMRAHRDKFDLTGFERAQLDLGNLDKTREKLGAFDFDLLINAALSGITPRSWRDAVADYVKSFYSKK
jgi:dTDP-4-dehydrorhamnose reductase